jgi:hypothetical protein
VSAVARNGLTRRSETALTPKRNGVRIAKPALGVEVKLF